MRISELVVNTIIEANSTELQPGGKISADSEKNNQYIKLAYSGPMKNKEVSIENAEIKRLQAELKKDPDNKLILRKLDKIQTQLIQIGKATHYYNVVRSQCSAYLSIRKTTRLRLFRGLNYHLDAFKGRPYDNRRPMHSSRKQQNELDRLLQAAGFDALRSNSTFVTTQERDIELYGGVYEIFPVNGFKFTWSTVFRDLTLDVFDNKKKLKSYNKLIQDPKISIDEKIKSFGFTSENFEQAMRSGNEIYLRGEYYAFAKENVNSDSSDRTLRYFYKMLREN